jgi:hypothetical protein
MRFHLTSLVAVAAAAGCSGPQDDRLQPETAIGQTASLPAGATSKGMLILQNDIAGLLSAARGTILSENGCFILSNGTDKQYLIFPTGSVRSADGELIYVPSLEGDYSVYRVGRRYNLAGGVVDNVTGSSTRFQVPRNTACNGAAFEVSKERRNQ